MIIVTGATGQLGGLIVERLLERMPADQMGVSGAGAVTRRGRVVRGCGAPWSCSRSTCSAVPSGLTASVQPQRWMTIWWWKLQSSTQSFADVVPPWALCGGVVDLAGAGGLGAAAGPLAVPVPQQHRVADPGRDRLGVADVQRQARPGQAHAELAPPQKLASPPGPDSRSTALPITACSRAAQAAVVSVPGVSVPGCPAAGRVPCPVPPLRVQFHAQPDEILQGVDVDVAGHDGRHRRVARDGRGGVAVEPGPVARAGLGRLRAVRGPAGPAPARSIPPAGRSRRRAGAGRPG